MKRPLIAAGGGILSIFVTVALLIGGAATIRGRESAATPEFILETPDLSDVHRAEARMPTALAARVARHCRGKCAGGGRAELRAGTSRACRATSTIAPLERIEPRAPLSEAVAKPQTAWQVLRHPVAVSAGLIRFGDRMLQLEGHQPAIGGACLRHRRRKLAVRRRCAHGIPQFPSGAGAALRDVPKDGWQGTLDRQLHCRRHRSRGLARRKRLGGGTCRLRIRALAAEARKESRSRAFSAPILAISMLTRPCRRFPTRPAGARPRPIQSRRTCKSPPRPLLPSSHAELDRS